MRNSLETRLGLFVGLALLAGFLILETIGSLDVLKHGYRVTALFGTVQELTVGAPVKMAGVPIGRVEEIAFADSKVKVTMKLSRGSLVKTDSKATIKFTGLMGQNFVSIDFGSSAAPVATEGTLLTTTEQPDFSVLMAKLDDVASGVENLTKSFSGDKIDNLLGPLMGFMKDNREPLTTAISNFTAVSAQVASGKGTVGKLLYDDALYTSAIGTVSNLNQAGEEVKLTVAEARAIVNQINAGQGTFGKLLKEDAVYQELAGSMTNLQQILEKVNRGEGTAARIVNDPGLYKNANMTLQKVDKATESLEDQGVLSVLGIMIGRLF